MVLSNDIDALCQRQIPGGWTERRVRCGEHVWNLMLPADADEFLNQLDALRPEDHEPDVYWAKLWPTALTMANLLPRAGWPAEAKVLELGCGVGVVGLAALAAGWHVTFSDYVPIAVELAVANAARNGFSAEGWLFDWKQPADRQFDGIVASDILYDHSQHAAIVSVLETMLRPGGTAWIGDPGRYHVSKFVDLIGESAMDIELSNELGHPLSKVTAGEFQVLRIRRSTR